MAYNRHLNTRHPHLKLLVEPHTYADHPLPHLTVVQPGDEELLGAHTDLVVTLGGDGTILHVSNLFNGGECPPVLSFSLGSLGFLLPFRTHLTLKSKKSCA
jgi:NADH kinase